MSHAVRSHHFGTETLIAEQRNGSIFELIEIEGYFHERELKSKGCQMCIVHVDDTDIQFQVVPMSICIASTWLRWNLLEFFFYLTSFKTRWKWSERIGKNTHHMTEIIFNCSSAQQAYAFESKIDTCMGFGRIQTAATPETCWIQLVNVLMRVKVSGLPEPQKGYHATMPTNCPLTTNGPPASR